MADSWFGTVKCALELKARDLYSVMAVKGGHKGYPKEVLLGKITRSSVQFCMHAEDVRGRGSADSRVGCGMDGQERHACCWHMH